MSAPRHLLDCWTEVARRVRRAGKVALFADLDGTLARIRRRPEEVRLPPRIRALLGEIAANHVTVGIISGRGLEDLEARVGLEGIWYAGAHGYCLRDLSGRTRSWIGPTQETRMREVRQRLEGEIGALPGIRLEPKGPTVAVHYREAPRRSRELARAAIGQLLESHPRLHLLSGKKVWELLPASGVDKWEAIRRILRLERNRGSGGWLTFYLGDDTTDERVFDQMKGISIAVGKRRRTKARYFLDTTAEVRIFLEKFREVLWLRQPKSHSGS
jgi:trehalose-phosphatase